jgi:hypothetical protein
MITANDLSRLMAAVEREPELFLTGQFGIDVGFRQADAMTIFGPFGGPAPTMPPGELLALQQAASKQFEFGETTFEVVNQIVTDDVVVLVMIERNRVRLTGASEFQPWVLRTTQAFRLDEDGQWWRLHRHADPLIRFRPGDETFTLARDCSG